jgi:hypothetical protein
LTAQASSGVLRRKEQALQTEPTRGNGNGKDPANGVDAAIERQLAEHDGVCNRVAGEWSRGRQQTKGDRKVEGRPGLAHVGRRQIDGDAVVRELESRVANGRPHPVAAFAHRCVGQADHREVRQAKRDVHLDQHWEGIDPEHGGATEAGKHVNGCAKRRVALQSRGIPRKTAFGQLPPLHFP